MTEVGKSAPQWEQQPQECPCVNIFDRGAQQEWPEKAAVESYYYYCSFCLAHDWLAHFFSIMIFVRPLQGVSPRRSAVRYGDTNAGVFVCFNRIYN